MGKKLALVLLAAFVPALAQNASVAGTVRDPQQGVVPNATVTLKNAETGVSSITKTDAAGNY